MKNSGILGTWSAVPEETVGRACPRVWQEEGLQSTAPGTCRTAPRSSHRTKPTIHPTGSRGTGCSPRCQCGVARIFISLVCATGRWENCDPLTCPSRCDLGCSLVHHDAMEDASVSADWEFSATESCQNSGSTTPRPDAVTASLWRSGARCALVWRENASSGFVFRACAVQTRTKPLSPGGNEQRRATSFTQRRASRHGPAATLMALAMAPTVRLASGCPRLAVRRSRTAVTGGRRAHVVVAVRACAIQNAAAPHYSRRCEHAGPASCCNRSEKPEFRWETARSPHVLKR